jgi:hypothetical protein
MLKFLDNVERHTHKSFKQKEDVARLLRVAERRSMQQVLIDAVFHGTFVVKTRDVMQRIGNGAEGFDSLSAQFSEGLERVSALLRTLIKEEPDEEKHRFTHDYLSMNQESLSRLLALLGDLSLIKHWEVDGNALPFEGYVPTPVEPKGSNAMERHLRNMIIAARLAMALLILVLLVDGPFTLLGWIIALLAAGFLIVVQYEAAAAKKEFSS